MNYFKFVVVFLAFLLIITLYDMNNFLSIGIVSLFLIINITIFIFVSDSIIVGCRNIFGLLSLEILVYWVLLSILNRMELFNNLPKIDFSGIASSLIFTCGVSVFFFLLFLIIDWVAKGTPKI
jgi:hypothetical protein